MKLCLKIKDGSPIYSLIIISQKTQRKAKLGNLTVVS